MSSEPTILFTGFEPSGDDHASAVIAELKRRRPGLRIAAWGGPKMEAAGAELVERTGRDAVMGLPGLKKIQEHRKINARVEQWLDAHKVAMHVPVDSPAANFPICAMAKKRGIKVVHLVAPQIWAWGSWRIRKLRRLTDFVCCLLPFEEQFFGSRGVRCRFVGHPLFDEQQDLAALDARIGDWAEGSPKVALLPGSRPKEMERNFPLLVQAFRRLRAEHKEMAGVVAAASAEAEPVLRELAGDWPEGLSMVHGQTDEAIRWCDMSLVVSGTVTLQVARQAKPMVVVYKSSRLLYEVLGRWLVRTPFFGLPNLIAGREIVPEFIPHFGGHEPILSAAVELLERPERAGGQRRDLERAMRAFEGRNAAVSTADVIEQVLDGIG